MQFTRLENRMPEGERFDQAMFVRVLKIEGKCSCLRAKAAPYSGHLPQGNTPLLQVHFPTTAGQGGLQRSELLSQVRPRRGGRTRYWWVCRCLAHCRCGAL